MAKRLQRNELVSLVELVIHPKGKGFTSEQINKKLLEFCINCPDPVAAMEIVLNAPRGSTADEITTEALARARCDPNSLPERRLARTHPLRRMQVEE